MAHSILPAFCSAPEFVYRLTVQIQALDVLVRTHVFQREQLAIKMVDLEQQGVVYAKPYFHHGKYLYLIHKMREGHRKRVYIGSDRQRVSEAEAAIERGKEHQVIGQQLHMVDRQLANLTEELDLFILNIKETL